MTDDDEANLNDLEDAEEALTQAHQALTRAMIGPGREDRRRRRFAFHLGVARGKLAQISARVFAAKEEESA